MIIQYKCNRCGWTGFENELNTECTFQGSQEEPPEWENYCPDCNSTNIESLE